MVVVVIAVAVAVAVAVAAAVLICGVQRRRRLRSIKAGGGQSPDQSTACPSSEHYRYESKPSTIKDFFQVSDLLSSSIYLFIYLFIYLPIYLASLSPTKPRNVKMHTFHLVLLVLAVSVAIVSTEPLFGAGLLGLAILKGAVIKGAIIGSKLG